jgi:hypothetical protein
LLAERVLRLLRQALHHRREEQARRDGDDADPGRGELARHRQRHPDDSAFRGRVRDLSDLTVERRDRRGHHDHAALALGVRRVPLHRDRRSLRDQHRTDEVDLDDLAERRAGQRTLLADEPPGRRDASAIDRRVQAPEPVRGARDRRVDGGFVADVGPQERRIRAERGGRRRALRLVQVEEHGLATCAHDAFGGRESQSRGAAGDDRAKVVQFHEIVTSRR